MRTGNAMACFWLCPVVPAQLLLLPIRAVGCIIASTASLLLADQSGAAAPCPHLQMATARRSEALSAAAADSLYQSPTRSNRSLALASKVSLACPPAHQPACQSARLPVRPPACPLVWPMFTAITAGASSGCHCPTVVLAVVGGGGPCPAGGGVSAAAEPHRCQPPCHPLLRQ